MYYNEEETKLCRNKEKSMKSKKTQLCIYIIIIHNNKKSNR